MYINLINYLHIHQQGHLRKLFGNMLAPYLRGLHYGISLRADMEWRRRCKVKQFSVQSANLTWVYFAQYVYNLILFFNELPSIFTYHLDE